MMSPALWSECNRMPLSVSSQSGGDHLFCCPSHHVTFCATLSALTYIIFVQYFWLLSLHPLKTQFGICCNMTKNSLKVFFRPTHRVLYHCSSCIISFRCCIHSNYKFKFALIWSKGSFPIKYIIYPLKEFCNTTAPVSSPSAQVFLVRPSSSGVGAQCRVTRNYL